MAGYKLWDMDNMTSLTSIRIVDKRFYFGKPQGSFPEATMRSMSQHDFTEKSRQCVVQRRGTLGILPCTLRKYASCVLSVDDLHHVLEIPQILPTDHTFTTQSSTSKGLQLATFPLQPERFQRLCQVVRGPWGNKIR